MNDFLTFIEHKIAKWGKSDVGARLDEARRMQRWIDEWRLETEPVSYVAEPITPEVQRLAGGIG